jgi:hypothetical protein
MIVRKDFCAQRYNEAGWHAERLCGAIGSHNALTLIPARIAETQ